jgi:hypothetical protein
VIPERQVPGKLSYLCTLKTYDSPTLARAVSFFPSLPLHAEVAKTLVNKSTSRRSIQLDLQLPMSSLEDRDLVIIEEYFSQLELLRPLRRVVTHLVLRFTAPARCHIHVAVVGSV